MRKNKTLPQTIMHCRRHKSWGNGHVRARCMGGSPFSGARHWLCAFQSSYQEKPMLILPFILIKFSHRIPWPSSLFPTVTCLQGISFFHMSIVSTRSYCLHTPSSSSSLSILNHHHHIDCICSIGKNATLSCEFDQDPLFCAFINPDGNYTITITESLL